MRSFCNFLLLLFLALLVRESLMGQEVTLQDCWQKTRDHYPVSAQSIQLMEAVTQQQLENIRASWLPQIEIGAQATWQNDVPHISGIPMAVQMPMAPKDQYRFGLEVRQTLYDGNLSKARKSFELVSGKIETQNVEVQLREVTYLVAEVYFMLLILDEQKKQVDFLLDDLNSRIREVSVAVSGGMVLLTEQQLLEVEKLKVEKQLLALNENFHALQQSLSLFTGMTINGQTRLVYPDELALQQPVIRPEYELFTYEMERIEANRQLSRASRRPVVAAFSQMGYGNPGFNMLQDQFDTYFLVGLRLQWKPWDWNMASRNQKILAQQHALTGMRREAFELQQNQATLKLDAELTQYRKEMEKDAQITQLQGVIVENYRSRLKNGTITAAEYISAVNSESRARLALQITKLNYLQSLAKKYLTSGNE